MTWHEELARRNAAARRRRGLEPDDVAGTPVGRTDAGIGNAGMAQLVAARSEGDDPAPGLLPSIATAGGGVTDDLAALGVTSVYSTAVDNDDPPATMLGLGPDDGVTSVYSTTVDNDDPPATLFDRGHADGIPYVYSSPLDGDEARSTYASPLRSDGDVADDLGEEYGSVYYTDADEEAPAPVSDAERRARYGQVSDPVYAEYLVEEAVALERAGEIAKALDVARYVALYATKKEQQDALELYKRLGGTWKEQGTGGAAPDTPLGQEQAAAREQFAADPANRGTHHDAGAQAGDSGWAVTGLGSHGYGMDPQYLQSGTMQYHDDAQREAHVARLVDGTFVRPDGTPVASSLTEANVGQRMALAVNMRVRQLLEQRLAEAGEVELLGKLSALSNMDSALFPLIRQAQTKLGLPRGQVKGEAEAQLVAEGRMIYVMNRSGDFFIGEAELYVTHHSSFLAGGAVACAGEVALSGGRITAISNNSGHYQPGPAFLWQAVRQLEVLGADVDGLTAEIMGAGSIRGRTFLTTFGIGGQAPARWTMNSDRDLAMVRAHLEGRPLTTAAVAEEPVASGDGGYTTYEAEHAEALTPDVGYVEQQDHATQQDLAPEPGASDDSETSGYLSSVGVQYRDYSEDELFDLDDDEDDR